MELTEKTRIYLPKTIRWDREELAVFIDPEFPHWIGTDRRGAQIIEWIQEGMTFGQIVRHYAQQHGAETGKAWLHANDFIAALLRCEFAAMAPLVRSPYLGRALYARPTGLKELWFHTNNICNLSCSHCLVSSAPWVQDWGLPTDVFLNLVDEGVSLGVDRFYFTGGEPFMRKDIIELIRHVTETRGCELIILTNATLLKGEKADQVRILNRQKLRFQVSIDGATPETNDPIRGKGSFQAAVDGLRFLTSLGFPTSVTTAVTGSNVKDLLGITRLAARLGVKTQHLMWLHKRGRMVGQEEAAVSAAAAVSTNSNGSNGSTAGIRAFAAQTELGFPENSQLIEAVRKVKAQADELGVAIDNIESIKQRINSRPGVKYDLGNACWDSLCVYSDGKVYPSAAMANFKPLTLGSLKETPSLREIWERSPVAEAFRQASVTRKIHLADDPLRYLTGGGDLEHSFFFNLDGESRSFSIAPQKILEILSGPDPYYPVYQAMIQDAMWDLVKTKREAVNRRSGYDAPRILHAMGAGAIHCATDDLAVSGEIDVRTLHSNCVLAFDVDKPRRLVREFYGKAAETPQAELCCPTTFDDSVIAHIPKDVIDRFYGCGSPVTSAGLKPGETFLDLGSGAGIDVFIAAKFVGPAGKAIGVDMTDQMLKVADENRPIVAKNLGYDVVEFRKGFLESVPAPSKTVDLVTSNCVVNLSPDKPKVFSEIWRILKDNGRVVIADIVSDRPVPAHLKVNPRLWGECTVGALTQEEFLAQLQEAGFYGLSILKKVYWKSIDGYDFYSVTVSGYKFEKTAGCQFIGQKAVYLGPMKSVMDEEGHLFPRDVEVEVCTDTAAKLSHPPYAGSFVVLQPDAKRVEMTAAMQKGRNDCGPGCC
ncbi:MAG: methyltransferase domain-containing protein [Candidatus Omnitrophica bacterium]|nr:methyltransferase domain-containing protein [Candidatus Omnitrophota bacterium]